MAETVEQKDGYKVKLPNFEGPLDLLLYLIKKEEIDIYDIPIAEITKQYLGYIDLMRELDLEVAGEFILMAATLIQIKVRMLLPKSEEPAEEEEDPRAELVRRLLEYQRFKEVAESLEEMEANHRRLYGRSYFDWEKKNENTEVILKDISLFDLLSAFKVVLENIPSVTSHEVGVVGVTIEEQIAFLEERLKTSERLAFQEIVSGMKERVVVIVTFMAILELIRTHRIRVQQGSIFGEIYIVRTGG